jgi:hypothetical protein
MQFGVDPNNVSVHDSGLYSFCTYLAVHVRIQTLQIAIIVCNGVIKLFSKTMDGFALLIKFLFPTVRAYGLQNR